MVEFVGANRRKGPIFVSLKFAESPPYKEGISTQ